MEASFLKRTTKSSKCGTGAAKGVEILDPTGRAIAGFGPSDIFQGDNLRHNVMWRGGFDVSQFMGKPISLKFYLKAAESYSFAFRE